MNRSRDMYDKAKRFAQDVDLLLDGQPVEEPSDNAYRADLELANALSRVQFVPKPRFKSRLRSHLLHQLYEKEEVKTMSIVKVFRSLVRPVLVAGLSAIVVLGVVFAASPDVRAAAQEWVARFVEVDSPWALLPAGEKRPAPPTTIAVPGEKTADATISGTSSGKEEFPGPDNQGVEGEFPGLGNQGVETESGQLPVPDAQPNRELISLEAAQAKLDFKIRVPSVLPEGYTFLGVAPMPELPSRMPNGAEPPADLPKVKPPQVATLVFRNSAGEVLFLSEALMNDPVPTEVPLPAGQGSVQDVTVNGQPAQYIEGLWSPGGWVSEGNRQLHWQDAEGITFDLISRTLGLGDLLAIAESIN